MSNLQLDFDALNAEKTELTDFLSQPDSYADKNFAAKNRRLGEINTLLELGKKRTQLEADIEMASNDPDFADMKPEFEREYAEIEQKLTEMLIPRDPNDDKAAILEIRAGAGGDEASLFAGDLYRMYLRYAETHGLKVELESESVNDAGGYKEVIVRISGEEPYGKLKFEGGVHRVFQLPKAKVAFILALLRLPSSQRLKKPILKSSPKIFASTFIVLAATVGRASIRPTPLFVSRISRPVLLLLCKTNVLSNKTVSAP